MLNERYRITESTIAMFPEDGRDVAHHVPAGAIVMADGDLNGDKLTDVFWDDKNVMMFTQDLRTRATREPVNSN